MAVPTNRRLRLSIGWMLAMGFGVCLVAGAGIAQTQTPPAAGPPPGGPPQRHHREDAKRQVEKLEQMYRDAQISADVVTMDKLLSDDYIGISMTGQVVTKMQQLERTRTRQVVLTKIALDDVKVKLIGNAVAIVTSLAEVEGTSDGASVMGKYRYTRVYARQDSGDWKITNFEATRVGNPPPGGAPGKGPRGAPKPE